MGHRGNVLIHEGGQTYGCAEKGFVHDIPALVACGPDFALAWAREHLENASSRLHQVDIWDEIMTEGAILINLDSKDLIFGSWEWLPDFCRFDEIPEELELYLEFPDIARELLEVVREQWAGWTVTLALPAEFATQETLIVRGQDLTRPLITDTNAPETGWSRERIREGFRFMFSMTREPLRTKLTGVQL